MPNISAYDIYASGTSFYINQGDRKRVSQRFQKSYQSQCGAVFSMIVQLLCFGYLVNMVIRMYALEDDDYKSVPQVNPQDLTTKDEIRLGEMNAYWSIDIRNTQGSKSLEKFGITY